jgi:uncharacterized sporulation protein YeaH/YhbH (DUF444 family)
MSLNISDRRKITRDRTAENRQRFLRRIKSTIKEQLPKIISGRPITEIDSGGGKIRVSRKTIREPFLHHDHGGSIDRVLPGNSEYVEGDLIDKPQGGGSGRGQAGSNSGEGEDDFIVELSREEFLQSFFEDLELPPMLQTEFSQLKEIIRENAGFQNEGPPTKLSVVKSYKNSLARRMAINSGLDEEIKELELKLAQILEQGTDLLDLVVLEIKAELDELIRRRDNVPFFEDIDLRFKTSLNRVLLKTHATMIMIMDNSGSMGVKEKTIARKFFWLLYRFLKNNYEKIDLRFISHTTQATEMEEEEFFNTRETGGTIVSSALDLTSSIIKELKGKTNIYVAQVSDGDNVDTDNGTCTEILEEEILPFTRYYAYIQVDEYHDSRGANPTITGLLNYEKGLWKSYNNVSKNFSQLQARRVFSDKDIYPVFVDLFSKK